MRDEMRARFESHASELAGDIEKILTPEQRKFDAFVARVRAKDQALEQPSDSPRR